jgi:4-diphosphocytidyl-2-C-methyl-D-erythritol kinase
MLLKARAKINIGLRILGPRPDGYHEIISVLQEIDLTDDLQLELAPDRSLTMTCDRPDLPADESNLCLKAARLLQETTGCQRGANITLTKRIPMGAGLGGGSSDAAATLKGLNRLWDLGLDQEVMLSLAARLGSDVPFFIQGGCCLALGRGEILRKMRALVHGPMILVVPNVHVSTTWAYKTIKNYPLTSREDYTIFQRSSKNELPLEQFRAIFINDFEPPIFDHYPGLCQLKNTLLTSGAWYASLSGSGSALYALFEEEATARQSLPQVASYGLTQLIYL